MQTQKLAALAAILGGAVALAPPADAQETLTLQTIHSSGANTSLGAAQMLDISDGTNLPLFSAALTAFNAKNSDTVRQDATNFTPGGQLVSPQFFPFGGPSVPVNSNVAAVGHLTAPGTAGATNYFGFAEAAGGQIGVVGTATAPPNQGTELFLYDNASNLVALATGNVDGLSSRIDFTVPDGSGGIWQAAITQGVDFTSPIDYRLQFQMPYSALSPFTTNVIGSGQEKSGSLGAYDVNANAGDNLSFDVHATTPLTGTELLLYDPKATSSHSRRKMAPMDSLRSSISSSRAGTRANGRLWSRLTPMFRFRSRTPTTSPSKASAAWARSTPRLFPSPRPG